MIPITLHWYSPLSAPPFLIRLIRSDQRLCFHQFVRPGACTRLSRAVSSGLFRPARGGLSVDVGKAGEMLRVLVLWVPARAQGRVHVPRGGIAGWMHRWAGVTAVRWRHIWPPGCDRCRVQPRSAAHQARLHSRHLAVELVLRKRRRRGKKLWDVIYRELSQLFPPVCSLYAKLGINLLI